VHAESLPPSVRKPLLLIDALDAVASAGYLPSYGNTTAWGGGVPRVEHFGAGEAGLQVVRSDFDALLLRLASDAGAQVIADAAVQSAEIDVDGGGTSLVSWSGASGAGRLHARWVIDASGRAGVLARRGLRIRDRVPPTTALLGVWRRAGGWPSENPSHTVVESYRDGWAWSVPVTDGRRWVAAMIDPAATRLERAGGREGLYRAEVAKTRLIGGLLEGATLTTVPWACAAGTYGARRYTGRNFLLAGDAGAFLDPLSSAGVKKALASGCLAGIVVNTCLAEEQRSALALGLYEEHERSVHAHHAARAAAFYAEAATAHDHTYWHARAEPGAAVADAVEAVKAGTPLDLARDPRFVASLAALRRTPDVRLRPAAALARVARPSVLGREVVAVDYLATAAAPGGVRYFGSVELPALVDAAAAHPAVPDLFAAYDRARPGAEPRDLVGALSVLVAYGMLVPTEPMLDDPSPEPGPGTL
jgi:flavin-dependent dehydrogenase